MGKKPLKSITYNYFKKPFKINNLRFDKDARMCYNNRVIAEMYL